MYGLTFILGIKWIFFTSLFLVYCYFFGYYINMLLKKKSEHGIKNIAIGFVCLLAIIQAGTWFMVAYSLPFSAFCIEVAVIIIGSIAFCIYMQKNNSDIKIFNHLGKLSREEKIVILIFICVLALQILMTFIKYRSDADDSFYVSNSAMFLNEKILNMYDSTMGNKSNAPLVLYNFQIWEVFLSFLSKMFLFEPVVFAHTIIIPFLLICSAAAYVSLGKKLFSKSMHANIFYILISIFHLMGGFAVYSQGSFLLSRIWQGKAVYLCIVLPLFMGWMLELYEDSVNKMNYLTITICILAGLALNPTSMYILGFQMAAMFVVICLKKKSLRIALYSAPSIVVYGIFAVLLYLKTSQYPKFIEVISKLDLNMIYTLFINFFGSGIGYFIMYLISIVVVFKYGSNNSKILFIYTPLVLLLCVWNPLMGDFIAKHFTSATTYWRVFWLIPAGTGVAYTIILITERLKIKGIKKVCLLVLCIITFSCPGKWMFSESNNFINATNVERIPIVVLNFGKIISKDGDSADNITLGPSKFYTTLRQKFTNVELVDSKYISEIYRFRGKEDIFTERLRLSNFIEGIEDGNYKDIMELLDKYSVKWVIIKQERTEALNYLCENNYRIITQEDNYILLKKNS
ncbi:MAG: hypothetical protein K0R54_2411 [Clostridiaceae bacterium]|jgi:hypothetical protein|nr:hypothetical protein [Clostridiaceae bacterium]